MSDNKLRQKIAVEAARLMVNRQELSLPRARLRAARTFTRSYVKPDQFPSEAEIRDEIERSSYVQGGDARFDNLRELRLTALSAMRILEDFGPRIRGDALQGNVRSGNVIEILLDEKYLGGNFTGSEFELCADESERNDNGSHASAFEIDIDFCEPDQLEGATLEEFEELLCFEYPDLDLTRDLVEQADQLDRFQVYRMLLAPLQQVHQRSRLHPEGDALYHSLQVFSLAQEQFSYDEEVLLAALLHDVGKGIDSLNPIPAAINALNGYITERTAWLIENLSDARRILDGSIGSRARRRLNQHPDYEELLTLARCDLNGRVPGADAPDLEEALESIRDLARLCS